MGKKQEGRYSPKINLKKGAIQKKKNCIPVSPGQDGRSLFTKRIFDDEDFFIEQPTSNLLRITPAYDFENSEKEQKIVEIVKSDMNECDFAKYIDISDIFADPKYPANSLSYEIQGIAMNYFNVQSIVRTPVLSDNLLNLLNKQMVLFLQKDTRQLTQFYSINTDHFSSDIYYEFDAVFYEQISSIINAQNAKETVQRYSIKQLKEENDEASQLKDQEGKEQQTKGVESQDSRDGIDVKIKIEEVLQHWENQVKQHNPEISINQYYHNLVKQRNPNLLLEKAKEKYRQRIRLRDQRRYLKLKLSMPNSLKDQAEYYAMLKNLNPKSLSHPRIPENILENHSFDDESNKQFVIEQEEKLKQYQALLNTNQADGQLERQSQESELLKICNHLLGEQNNTVLNSKNQDQAVYLYQHSLFKQLKSSAPIQQDNCGNSFPSKTLPSHSDICRSIGKDLNLNQFILNNLSTEILNDKEDKDKTKSGALPNNSYFNNEIYSNFLRFVFQTLSKEHLEELQLGKYEIEVIVRIVWKMREINMISNRTPRLRYQSYHLMLFFLTITKENTPQLRGHLKLSFLHEKIFGIIDFTDQRSLLRANIFKRIMGEIALMQISYLTKQFTDFYGDEFFKPNQIFTDCQSMIYYLMQIQKRIVQYLQGIMCFGI